MDSVSYAIGVDIGMNFKRAKLEDANLDAMHMGLRDGLDSAAMMDAEVVKQVVSGYMMKLDEKRRAEEAKKFEGVRLEGEKYLAENGKKKGVTTTPSGLQYEVITMGTGAKPVATDQVKVHYTGTLIDGTKFDSSVDNGEPVTYAVTGFVPGWVEALQLMPVGSKWKLHIPSDLAYGAQGTPDGRVPPNSVLVFDLELLDIIK
ncbi:MAG: FKBP-type peptidyl-prolyl cis-trans isomerase [Flavobacteriales bacterium]|nr:FKBP-type peptidyl-prolyl cis-trans isomerase [Flavobacteriales bacterium]